MERAKKGIEFEVSRAYFKVEEAKTRVELAQAALKEAQESLRIVEKRYRNGISSITELLDTQTALNAARSNYVKALSDYKISLVNLLHAQGILSEKYSELSE
jgi:outer membrane protein TolC